jgi:hypothetical protein
MTYPKTLASNYDVCFLWMDGVWESFATVSSARVFWLRADCEMSRLWLFVFCLFSSVSGFCYNRYRVVGSTDITAYVSPAFTSYISVSLFRDSFDRTKWIRFPSSWIIPYFDVWMLSILSMPTLFFLFPFVSEIHPCVDYLDGITRFQYIVGKSFRIHTIGCSCGRKEEWELTTVGWIFVFTDLRCW